jgi:hypothetical protein
LPEILRPAKQIRHTAFLRSFWRLQMPPFITDNFEGRLWFFFLSIERSHAKNVSWYWQQIMNELFDEAWWNHISAIAVRLIFSPLQLNMNLNNLSFLRREWFCRGLSRSTHGDYAWLSDEKLPSWKWNGKLSLNSRLVRSYPLGARYP